MDLQYMAGNVMSVHTYKPFLYISLTIIQDNINNKNKNISYAIL